MPTACDKGVAVLGRELVPASPNRAAACNIELQEQLVVSGMRLAFRPCRLANAAEHAHKEFQSGQCPFGDVRDKARARAAAPAARFCRGRECARKAAVWLARVRVAAMPGQEV